jgi:hypothetical protein
MKVLLVLASTVVLWLPQETPPKQDAATDLERRRADLDQLLIENRPRAKERRLGIEHELETGNLPAWAGIYAVGSRGSGEVAAAPRAGLTYMVQYDVWGSDRWNHGAISNATDRRFEVEFLLPHDADRRWALGVRTPVVFHFIRWADREYLVPEERMIAFCNAVNDGSERWNPSSSWFPCRIRSSPAKVYGSDTVPLPEVPEDFRKYLLEGPVSSTVTTVSSSTSLESRTPHENRIETVVVADAGRAQHLERGMVFHVQTPEGLGGAGEVVEVDDTTCRVRIVNHCPEGQVRSPIVVGTKLSTLKPVPDYVNRILEHLKSRR